MKALVTYYSQTGNTEKLARAIYDAIHFEKELLPIKEVKSSKGYDIIFVGIPRPGPQRARRGPSLLQEPARRDSRSPSFAPMVHSGAAIFPNRRSNTP